MKYQEIKPGERLQSYVKYYYIFESETSVEMEDTVFPCGKMEIIFNLGEGIWQTAFDGVFHTTPPVELWGQITQPLPVRAFGKNTMLGVKFFSHTAACFLDTDAWEFNDQVADLRDVLGPAVKELHGRLLETPSLSKRVELLERFLLHRLSIKRKRAERAVMIGEIMKEMQRNAYTDRIVSTASEYNITPRYLQKLFLQYTGFTPKLYTKISRFQQSLQLIAKNQRSFTSIAYDCGYFDQAHFIRDFKSFTGMTPSAYSLESFPVSLVLSPQ
jgi:AraC-like DNA-binding protein